MKIVNLTKEQLIQRINMLESNADYYHFIVNNRQALEIYCDKNRKITFVNNSLKEFTDYSQAEFINGVVSIEEIIHPEDLEMFISETTGYAKQIKQLDFSIRLISKDNKSNRVEYKSEPLYKNYKFQGNRITIIPTKYDSNSKQINRLKKKIDAQKEINNRISKEWNEKVENLTIKNNNQQRKLDYILSPSSSVKDIMLTDLIDLKQLQKIQDAFVKATGVASIITDVSGTPITKPTLFNGVCKAVRATQKGAVNCSKSDRYIGKKTCESNKPMYEQCKSCGFIDAGAPINIGDQQIGIWLIGQVNFGQLNEPKIRQYAKQIGANEEFLAEELSKVPITDENKFKNTVDFLWILADEISNLAYRNFDLSKKIKKLKKIENELTIAHKKSEESDQLKTAFLNSISHEIRTPMNAIIGFTELLVETNVNQAKRQKYSTIITDNTHQLLSIVTDFLTISSLNTKQEKLSLKPASLNEMCDQMFNIFYRQLKEKSVTLIINKGLNDTASKIITDASKLTDIIKRLLHNAIKFSNASAVELGYFVEEENIQFYIKDSGIGIEEDKQSKIFKLFSHIDASIQNEYGGTGLGLSIVKELIHLFKGEIWVKSQPNKGSTFYFTIPYSKIINSDIEMPTINRSTKKSITILIAEDNESNYLYLEEILKSINCKIIHAINGKKAIDICKQNPYIDLILMDIKMPIIDGHTAALKIKQFRPELPIIAQSAFALEHEKIRFSGEAFNEYVTKPINKEILVKTIKKVMAIDLPIDS